MAASMAASMEPPLFQRMSQDPPWHFGRCRDASEMRSPVAEVKPGLVVKSVVQNEGRSGHAGHQRPQLRRGRKGFERSWYGEVSESPPKSGNIGSSKNNKVFHKTVTPLWPACSPLPVLLPMERIPRPVTGDDFASISFRGSLRSSLRWLGGFCRAGSVLLEHRAPTGLGQPTRLPALQRIRCRRRG